MVFTKWLTVKGGAPIFLCLVCTMAAKRAAAARRPLLPEPAKAGEYVCNGRKGQGSMSMEGWGRACNRTDPFSPLNSLGANGPFTGLARLVIKLFGRWGHFFYSPMNRHGLDWGL